MELFLGRDARAIGLLSEQERNAESYGDNATVLPLALIEVEFLVADKIPQKK